MARPANLQCPCGRGLSYKRCCRDKGARPLSRYEKAMAGMLRPTVRIRSSGSESVGITVERIAVTRNGITTVHLDEPISLNTNAALGDKTEETVAVLTFPSDLTTSAKNHTLGNATVSSVPTPVQVALSNGVGLLSCSSESDLFAVAKIKAHRRTGQGYFDLIFGAGGSQVKLDKDGRRNRPHISLTPDGNGKVLRLSGRRCEVQAEMVCLPELHRISPVTFRVRFVEHGAHHCKCPAILGQCRRECCVQHQLNPQRFIAGELAQPSLGLRLPRQLIKQRADVGLQDVTCVTVVDTGRWHVSPFFDLR
jgi:hypothetical protein